MATVTVDNDKDTLTVEAVSPGTATITITAKNSQGSANQTFTVTVPRPPADPVDIPDIPSLEEDTTHTIRLGNKFSGEDLTYTATSSRPSVATATVDNDADTLTVTAVGPGTATSRSPLWHKAASPRPRPLPPPCPNRKKSPGGGETPGTDTTSTKWPASCGAHLEITRHGNAKCTLQTGQRLESRDESSVSVKNPGLGETRNIWTITAHKKGLHEVLIFNKADNVGTILVKVPNTSPNLIEALSVLAVELHRSTLLVFTQ